MKDKELFKELKEEIKGIIVNPISPIREGIFIEILYKLFSYKKLGGSFESFIELMEIEITSIKKQHAEIRWDIYKFIINYAKSLRK